MHRIENFELSTFRVVAFQAKAEAVIRVTAGRLWLTVQGQPHDVWLQAGESWRVPGANAVLWLSAEPMACFQMAHAIAPRRRPAAQLAVAAKAGSGWWSSPVRSTRSTTTRATPTSPATSVAGSQGLSRTSVLDVHAIPVTQITGFCPHPALPSAPGVA